MISSAVLLKLFLSPLGESLNEIGLVFLHLLFLSAKTAAEHIVRDTADAPAALGA
jgi:hypothetical protein